MQADRFAGGPAQHNAETNVFGAPQQEDPPRYNPAYSPHSQNVANPPYLFQPSSRKTSLYGFADFF